MIRSRPTLDVAFYGTVRLRRGLLFPFFVWGAFASVLWVGPRLHSGEASGDLSSAAHWIRPADAERVEQALSRAGKSKTPDDLLTLLNSQDERTAIVTALLLAADSKNLRTLDSILASPRCGRPEYLITALAVASDSQGVDILVKHLQRTDSDAERDLAAATLEGLTGKTFESPAEWQEWWEQSRATFQFHPAPFDQRIAQFEKRFSDLLSERVQHVLQQARETAEAKLQITAEQFDKLMQEVNRIREDGQALARSPKADNASVMFGMAEYRQAFSEYNAALDKDPDNRLCLYMRAACLIQIGEYRQAREAFATLASACSDANLAAWLRDYCAFRIENPGASPLEAVLDGIDHVDVSRRPATAGWMDPVVPALFVQTERQITASATAAIRARRLLESDPANPETIVGTAFLQSADAAVALLVENQSHLIGLVPFQTALLQTHMGIAGDEVDALRSLLMELAELDPENGFFPALLAYYTDHARVAENDDEDMPPQLSEEQARALLSALRRPGVRTYASCLTSACMRTLQNARVPFAAAIATQMSTRSLHHSRPLNRLALQCLSTSEAALEKGNTKRAVAMARCTVRLGELLQAGSDRTQDVITGSHIEKNGRFQLMRIFTETDEVEKAGAQRTRAMTAVLRIQHLKDLSALLGALVLVPVPEIQNAWYGAAVESEMGLLDRLPR